MPGPAEGHSTPAVTPQSPPLPLLPQSRDLLHRGSPNVKPLRLKPGVHWYWPLVTEIEIIPTARQTISLPIQVQTTKDNIKVVVGTIVVYHIDDIVHAIGKMNWDADSTVNDISQGAVARVIATHTFAEIMAGMADSSIVKRLTHEVRKELRPFGVKIRRCKIVDFADCKVYKLVNSSDGHGHHLSVPQH